MERPMKQRTPTRLGQYINDFMTSKEWTIEELSKESNIPKNQILNAIETGEVYFTKHYIRLSETIANHTAYSVGFVLNRLRILMEDKISIRGLHE